MSGGFQIFEKEYKLGNKSFNIFEKDYDFGVVPVYKVVKTTNLMEYDEDDEKWLSKAEIDKIGGWITFNEEGKEGKITDNGDGTVSSSAGVFFTRVPHVPCNVVNGKKVVIGNSGVTIGRGLDVGQINLSTLKKYLDHVGTKAKPINKKLYDFLVKANLKTQSVAIDVWDEEKTYTEVNKVKRHKKEYVLSRKQQYYLFAIVYPVYEDSALIGRLQNRTDNKGVGEKMTQQEVNRIPQCIKEVLTDMTYQGHLRQSILKEIIPFLKSQQYEKVYTFFSKNEMLLDYKPRLEVRLNNMSIYRPKEYKGVFK